MSTAVNTPIMLEGINCKKERTDAEQKKARSHDDDSMTQLW
jgi:hypothetical protein